MSNHKKTVVVVSTSDVGERHSLESLLQDVATCEHFLGQEDVTGVESQQVDHHMSRVQDDAMQERLEELMHDRRYTGASHVFLLQGESLLNPSVQHSAMLKALMEKSTTSKQDVIAVLLPNSIEQTDLELAQSNFQDAVASHESLLRPFANVKVHTSLQCAAHQLGAF